MAGKAHESHGVSSELNSVFDLEKVDQWNAITTSTIQSKPRSMRFWAFPTMKRELRDKFRSVYRSAARFREVGGT
jgi:hypothetical protein